MSATDGSITQTTTYAAVAGTNNYLDTVTTKTDSSVHEVLINYAADGKTASTTTTTDTAISDSIKTVTSSTANGSS